MQHDTMAVPAVGGPATGATTGATTGAPTDAGDIVILSDATFDAAVGGASGLVLVDFGADRCAPCRMMKPVIERLARQYRGRVTVATLDVDANPRIAARFTVRSIPTFLFFRDGEAVAGIVGAVAESRLAAQLDALLAGGDDPSPPAA